MKKLIAILLAMVITALSLNAGLAYHYCGGSLAEVKLVLGYGEAGCGMDDEGNDCSTHEDGSAISSMPCCKDKLQGITTDNFICFTKLFQKFSTTISFSFIEEAFTFHNSAFSTQNIQYRPPPLISSVFLPKIQVFLI